MDNISSLTEDRTAANSNMTCAAYQAPLVVIGAGMARTGTYSLKNALEILYGHPCYHMSELIRNHRDHIGVWSRIFQGTARGVGVSFSDMEYIFRGYRAATDLPACAIYKELMNCYRDAKVILTVRDDESWIKSVRSTVRPNRRHLEGRLFGGVVERICLGTGFGEMADVSFQAALGWSVDLSDDDQMKAAYNARNEDVKRTVPEDQLLVFEVKDGWKPLCDFLGLPIPDQPFPKLNDTASLQRQFSKVYMTLRLVQVGALSACVAMLAFAIHMIGIPSFKTVS